jgi:hypothetical protein
MGSKFKWTRDVLPKAEIVEDTLKIDWDLFKRLLKFRSHSKSKEQHLLRNWLVCWINDNIPNTQIDIDKYGNVYITKGISSIYPCVVAHLDINQDDDVVNFEIIQTDKFIFGLDNDTGKQCGLGFDDKNGVYFGLLMLQNLDVVKCFFPLDEEIGCVGTKEAKMEFFQDCSLLIQLDRRSNFNDISKYTNGITVVSDEFKSASKSILKKFNYKYANCAYTDVGELVKQKAGCVGFNISAGYFEEHSDEEITSIPHYINAIHFAYNIIKNLGYIKRWNFIPVIPPPNLFTIPSKDFNKKEIKKSSLQDGVKDMDNFYHSTSDELDEKMDDDEIMDYLLDDSCPCCYGFFDISYLRNGELMCGKCTSVFFIPKWKKVSDCYDEYKAIQLVKEKSSEI